MMTQDCPEVRLYRIIKAFQELQAMRVVSLDRVSDIDDNYLDGGEELIRSITRRLQSGNDQDRALAEKIGEIMVPHWSKR